MTVKELKEALAQFPENMEVYMSEINSEFGLGLVNSVKSQVVIFSESPDFDKEKDEWANDTVVVIGDE